MPDLTAAELAALLDLPPREAIEFLERKGYAISWNWWEVWQEQQARAFTVAKLTRLDVLADIRREVERIFRDGITQREFFLELAPRLKAAGWWGKKIVVDSEGQAEIVQEGSPWRLETIFRTNAQTGYMAGRYRRQVDNAADRPYWQYVAVMDSRTRDSHAAMNGKIFRADDPIWSTMYPPNGFNCFLPGTEVAGRIELGLKTRYTGPAVEIETANGHHLAVTANHPVLTGRGWLPAHQLEQGDELLNHRFDVDALPGGIVDYRQPPAAVEDAFDTLRAEGFRVIPIAPFDFHGDAQLRERDIHVAGIDRVLPDGLETNSYQAVVDRLLRWADDRRGILGLPPGAAPLPHAQPVDPVLAQDPIDIAFAGAELGGQVANRDQRLAIPAQDLGLQGVVKTVGSAPGGAELAFHQGLAPLDLPPFMPLRLAAPARGDATQSQQPIDGIAAAAALYGELLDAFPGTVTRDHVVRVSKFDWSGHVYDFQTATGLIVANGIIVHNCRCRIRALSARQVEGRNLTVESSDGRLGSKTIDVGTDQRTGEVIRRPVSTLRILGPDGQPLDWHPDPGWSYNPALGQDAKLQDLLERRLGA